MELATELGVSVDTVRRNVRSKRKELELQPLKKKTPTSKGALVNCLSLDDSEIFIQSYRSKGARPDVTNQSRSYGYFYLIQLIPEWHPHRVKIGFADSVEKRLKEHQTAAPTAKLLGSWPCKRAWDQAVMDSLTRRGCTLVLNEVYEGDVPEFLARAEAFFALMPNPSTTVALSAHSPLRKQK